MAPKLLPAIRCDFPVSVPVTATEFFEIYDILLAWSDARLLAWCTAWLGLT